MKGSLNVGRFSLICSVMFYFVSTEVVLAGTFVKFHPRGTTQVAVESINASNVTVGFVFDGSVETGFIRAPDGGRTLFNVDGQGTAALGINTAGVVVGAYGNAQTHGFIRSPDGSLSSFDASGAGTGQGQGTWPVAINDKGSITGFFIDSSNVWHGFVRAQDGSMQVFDAGDSTLPRGINKNGVVAGEYVSGTHHAFLRTAKGSIITVDPPGAVDTTVAGINDQGEVLGGFSDGSKTYSFIRDAEGSFDTFTIAGSTVSDVSAINNNGVVAGAWLGKDQVWHGFIRYPDGSDFTLDAPRSVETAPECINDSDVIAGYYETGKNPILGFLWFP